MWASVKYACFVLQHKWYVLVFGLKVGGIPLWQLLIHDLSKFSRAEFGPYCRNFFTGMNRKSEWQVAWRHHWQNNPHHWEYWAYDGGRPILMPEVYVREMVADWQAANKAYGDEHIGVWFARKYPTMRLHPKTVETLRPLIAPLGLSIPPTPR